MVFSRASPDGGCLLVMTSYRRAYTGKMVENPVSAPNRLTHGPGRNAPLISSSASRRSLRVSGCPSMLGSRPRAFARCHNIRNTTFNMCLLFSYVIVAYLFIRFRRDPPKEGEPGSRCCPLVLPVVHNHVVNVDTAGHRQQAHDKTYKPHPELKHDFHLPSASATSATSRRGASQFGSANLRTVGTRSKG